MSLLAEIILDTPTEKILSKFYISESMVNDFKSRIGALMDLSVFDEHVKRFINEINSVSIPKDHVALADPEIMVWVSGCAETNS